ncbi:MAG: hypothetical protein V4658_04620 [Bacteroidota bacterium]
MEVYPEKLARFKGIYGYWCKVSFPLNGKRFIGYVPSQLLAMVNIRENNINYLVLVDEYKNNRLTCSLKIIDHFQLIAEHKFEPVTQDVYYPVEKDTTAAFVSAYIDLELFNNKGLEGIDRIARVSTSVGACGVWYGSNIFLLAQNKLIHSMMEEGIVDGGVYNYGYAHLFPEDSLGQKGIVLRNTWHYESAEGDTFADTWHTQVKLQWENLTFKKLDSTYSSKRVNIMEQQTESP